MMDKNSSNTLSWLHQGLDRRQILQRLENDGLTGSQCIEVFEDTYSVFRKEFKTKKRVKWIVAAVAFCGLSFFLPLSLTALHPILMAIALAFILAVLVVQAIEVYTNWECFKEESFGKKAKGFSGMILFVLLFIVFSAGFWLFFRNQKKDALDQKGINTEAKLIEMGRVETERAASITYKNVLKLKFITKDKVEVEMEVTRDTNELDLSNITSSSKFFIKYLPNSPDINDIDYIIK